MAKLNSIKENQVYQANQRYLYSILLFRLGKMAEPLFLDVYEQ